MNNLGLLQTKLNDLVELLLTDGVQPADLSDNIFLTSYEEISYKKINGQVIGELTFLENRHSNDIIVKLRYYYSKDKKILKIEEEIANEVKVIWDRDFTEKKLVEEILVILDKFYNKDQISKFIATLPEHLKGKILNTQNIIA
ncbi:hypothetical protein [Paenibacillus oleatilyticus]|uniref:Immunity protein 63 domain-containing protein n=1 Tax=Paenibacillus oleatilyticus TaxID=2594886 RepID=A0ABV4VA80_9BACL